MEGDWIFGFIMGGIFLLGLGICIGAVIEKNIGTDKLGQSICEEEYDMDFKSYNRDILKCEPMKEHYDGISVQLVYAGDND